MKSFKIYLGFFAFLFLFIFFGWKYIEYINAEKELKRVDAYKKEALVLQQKVSNMILVKQKATMAMAISIINNDRLAQDLQADKIQDDYYKILVSKFREHTHYKNIWIHVIDKNFISRYRSWSKKRGDEISYEQKDVSNVFVTKRPVSSISVNKSDLMIKAIIPIIKDGDVIGLLELISHFNSIDKEILKEGVDSVVVLNKEYKDSLEYPFTNIFINGYYVANLDVNPKWVEYLKKRDVKDFFTPTHLVEDGNLITSLELKSLDGKVLGHYVMFKDVEKILTPDIDVFVLKWIFLGITFLMAVVGLINIVLFYKMRNQKRYYKKIMDSSTNIVVINHENHILDVNEAFFKYFYEYRSLKDFQKEHKCICDFFQNQNGYLNKDMYGNGWMDYMLKNPDAHHLVKLKYDKQTHYFTVTASIIDKEKSINSAVFTDITKEENYKHELERLSTTDALTGMKNRHYFEEKINDEIHRSDRYKETFSLIMFDMDYFKRINDEHGRAKGDHILMEYTKLILDSLRDSDMICRIGGEAFVIILPKTYSVSAEAIAEKLRVLVEIHDEALPVTISLGVVEHRLDEQVQGLLRRVDRALYKAKEDGRNRVVAG